MPWSGRTLQGSGASFLAQPGNALALPLAGPGVSRGSHGEGLFSPTSLGLEGWESSRRPGTRLGSGCSQDASGVSSGQGLGHSMLCGIVLHENGMIPGLSPSLRSSWSSIPRLSDSQSSRATWSTLFPVSGESDTGILWPRKTDCILPGG